MAQNDEMKKYDFIEGTEFDGLMPKAMRMLSEEYPLFEIYQFQLHYQPLSRLPFVLK